MVIDAYFFCFVVGDSGKLGYYCITKGTLTLDWQEELFMEVGRGGGGVEHNYSDSKDNHNL